MRFFNIFLVSFFVFYLTLAIPVNGNSTIKYI